MGSAPRGGVAPEQDLQSPQSFHVPRRPGRALDSATIYLEAAGLLAPGLAGKTERNGDVLVLHHGRLETRIEATASAHAEGHSEVLVQRVGSAPWEASRRAVFVMGLIGTVLAWAIAIYNDEPGRGVSPLLSIAIFFAALVAVAAVLYVVDRSTEKRIHHLLMSLEEAMAGDPILILEREMLSLEKNGAVVHGLLFYCAAIVAEFVIFVILLSDGVRPAIDEVVTVQVMRQGFLLPVIPALLFGVGSLLWSRRTRRSRMELVLRRYAPSSARPMPAR